VSHLMIRMVHFKPAESAGFFNGEMGGNGMWSPA